MNRLGLKISCFLVSVVIWIQVANTADIEQTTTLPLRVTGLSEGLTVAGSEYLPPEVRVQVAETEIVFRRASDDSSSDSATAPACSRSTSR